MREVIEIIKQLRNTSSSNDKIAILKANKDNDLLKKVLVYTYDDSLKYGITEDVIRPYIQKVDGVVLYPFVMLDELAKSNINDHLRTLTGHMLGNMEEDERELFIQILTKDLRCNISTKTINKAIPNLIPEFGCMLASKYFDNEKIVNGKSFTLTMKMDGHRCIVVKNGSNVRAYTRQNKEYLGLDDILNEVAKLDGDFVIDGEILVENYRDIPPDTRYKATSNIVRKDGIKKGVKLIAFDMLPLDEFRNGVSFSPYAARRIMLQYDLANLEYIEVVEKLYQGSDTSIILPLLDKVVAKGEEGLMLNIDSAKYECKRTKGLLKLKKFQTGDMRVVDVLEGDGKYKGVLGAITVEFEDKGKIHRCNVGTGFSDEERILFMQSPQLLLDKIVEIKYFEVTNNAKGGTGLRFPVWVSRIRHDKNEISMN